MNTEEPTVEQILEEFKEEIGVGIGQAFILPIILAIVMHVWIGVWYMSLAVFVGCLIGSYEFGREEIAKKANQAIIKQAGR